VHSPGATAALVRDGLVETKRLRRCRTLSFCAGTVHGTWSDGGRCAGCLSVGCVLPDALLEGAVSSGVVSLDDEPGEDAITPPEGHLGSLSTGVSAALVVVVVGVVVLEVGRGANGASAGERVE
jgi:hypothetical protein